MSTANDFFKSDFMMEVWDVLDSGAAKHGDLGYKSRTLEHQLNKILRHTGAAVDGKFTDPESGKSTFAHIAARAYLASLKV